MPSSDHTADQPTYTPEAAKINRTEQPLSPTAFGQEKRAETPPTERGYDAVAKALNFLPRDKVKSPESWKKILEGALINPDLNPSFLLLKVQAEAWIDTNISVNKGKSTDEQHQAEIAAKRAQYKAELNNLLDEYRSRWEAALIAKRIEAHLQNTGESPISPDKVTQYKIKEVPVKAEGQVGVDIIDVIYDPNADPVVIERATEQVKNAHVLFRDYRNHPDRIISPVIFRGPDKDRPDNFQSHVTVTNPPISVINLNNPDNMGITSHETIHQVLMEQFGSPLNYDFAEGIAMRLGQALNPKTTGEYSVNLPVQLLLNLHPIPGQEADTIDSGTHLLSELQKQGVNAEQYAAYFPYIFGYSFMDSLLKSPTYKEASRQARLRGENIYQPIFKLNQDLTFDALSADGILKYDSQANIITKQREMLIHVLRKNGYDPDAILGDTTSAVKQWIQ